MLINNINDQIKSNQYNILDMERILNDNQIKIELYSIIIDQNFKTIECILEQVRNPNSQFVFEKSE